MFSFQLTAQVRREWVAVYTRSEFDDIPKGLALDRSGNIFVTGKSNDVLTGSDWATLKYNTNGVREWVKRYNVISNNYDEPGSLATDSSENIYVTGTGDSQMTTIKYNPSGSQIWIRTYISQDSQGGFGKAITIYGTGVVIIAGYTGESNLTYDGRIIKYNSSGIQFWTQSYSGSGYSDDHFNSVATDAAGNIYVTGYSYEGSFKEYDYLTIKYSASGDVLWTQRYNGEGNGIDRANAIAVDNAGNAYVTGTCYGINLNYDIVTIKYSSDGALQWIRMFSSPGGDEASALITDDSGNVYVTGGGYTGNDGRNFITIKYSTAGVQQWIQSFNGTGTFDEFSYAIAMDSAKNIYVTGNSGYFYVSDIITVKYSNSGELKWAERYNGAGNDEDVAVAVKVDRNNNVFITGKSKSNSSGFDFVTIKYSQTVGVNSVSTELPEKFSLEQNYPNPFNPATKIKFNLPSNVNRQTSNVKLMVYNTLGKQVAALVNQVLAAGSYEVEFNAADYPGGIYFYELRANGYYVTRKMLLLK